MSLLASLSLSSHCCLLHFVIIVSVYVFIFYLDTDFFWATEEYRKCVRHELLTAQRKGCEARMRRPPGILSLSLRRDLMSLPLWGFCFYFCLFFLQTTFLFSQCTRERVAQVRCPAENDQSFWIPSREDLIDLFGSAGYGCSSKDFRGWEL